MEIQCTYSSLTYKDSGVDIKKGDKFVENITRLVKSTYNKRVISGIGGFAALYDLGHGKYLSSSTDGVGTKLKVAQLLGIHHTIGQDLVAMCVNDLICTGSRPLFFLDYLACAKLDLKVSQNILQGIVKGCKLAEMALMGGETAEMPGMYQPGEYDLAGFSVGEVQKKDLVDGKKIKEGAILIGLASSGFHSNGYSLIRKIIGNDETALLKLALTPTKIYVKVILDLLKKFPNEVVGLCNITGSGLLNIPRLNDQFDYHITNLPKISTLPKIMQVVCERSGPLCGADLYSTWNMGIGFVVVANNEANALKINKYLKSKKEKAFLLGKVVKPKSKTAGKNKRSSQVIVESDHFQFRLS